MSNNLALSQVAAAQNQKEVTINDQAGQLDAGLTDKVDVALTGTTSPLALSEAQALRPTTRSSRSTRRSTMRRRFGT